MIFFAKSSFQDTRKRVIKILGWFVIIVLLISNNIVVGHRRKYHNIL